uniref:Uncharacterized protein n=1 Tax=Oryza brachyantha TaxID=4533 RepID=J3M9V1_ORYBR
MELNAIAAGSSTMRAVADDDGFTFAEVPPLAVPGAARCIGPPLYPIFGRPRSPPPPPEPETVEGASRLPLWRFRLLDQGQPPTQPADDGLDLDLDGEPAEPTYLYCPLCPALPVATAAAPPAACLENGRVVSPPVAPVGHRPEPQRRQGEVRVLERGLPLRLRAQGERRRRPCRCPELLRERRRQQQGRRSPEDVPPLQAGPRRDLRQRHRVPPELPPVLRIRRGVSCCACVSLHGFFLLCRLSSVLATIIRVQVQLKFVCCVWLISLAACF